MAVDGNKKVLSDITNLTIISTLGKEVYLVFCFFYFSLHRTNQIQKIIQILKTKYVMMEKKVLTAILLRYVLK
jgi:hypothetical protein